MLKENIKLIRKEKGISQEELASRLNVVRQTVSKWETGLSVPDAEMLISISKVLDTPISTLLGEDIPKDDELSNIIEKLEKMNLKQRQKKKIVEWLLILLGISIIVIFLFLYFFNSPYLNWDYNNPETAVLGVLFHIFEWIFIRIFPIVLIILVFLIFLLRKKNK